jgi:hypothetical protein
MAEEKVGAPLRRHILMEKAAEDAAAASAASAVGNMKQE